MTEAVVERAALRVREHLVCLHDLAEAVLRIRRARDVRVELPREAPKRALDLVGVRLPCNAQELVVVALGAQLSS
jgi:hypothetical protein